MTIAEDDRPTCPTSVYRYYDADGVLLYVGVTSRRSTRNIEHFDKSWWPFVASQEVDHYGSRAHALAQEQALIRRFLPPFNKQHNVGHVNARTVYLAYAEARKGHESPIENLNRVGRRLPLRVVGDRDADGMVTLTTLPENHPIARTIVPAKLSIRRPNQRAAGRVLDVEQLNLHTLVHAQVNADVWPFSSAVGRLKVLSFKPSVATRFTSVILDLP